MQMLLLPFHLRYLPLTSALIVTITCFVNMQVSVPFLMVLEWLSHSLAATEPSRQPFRVLIGGRQCRYPYSASPGWNAR